MSEGIDEPIWMGRSSRASHRGPRGPRAGFSSGHHGDLSPQQVELTKKVSKAVGNLLGEYLAYKVYRKLGAPTWAAWGIVTISSRLIHIHDELKKRS
jgi:hypothetical protein